MWRTSNHDHTTRTSEATVAFVKNALPDPKKGRLALQIGKFVDRSDKMLQISPRMPSSAPLLLKTCQGHPTHDPFILQTHLEHLEKNFQTSFLP